jgi:hypothetical protein
LKLDELMLTILAESLSVGPGGTPNASRLGAPDIDGAIAA